MSGVSGMGWPQRASSFWVLAVITAGVVAGLVAGLSEDPRDTKAASQREAIDPAAITTAQQTAVPEALQDAQPSPNQIVATRFSATRSAANDPLATAAIPAAAIAAPATKPSSGYMLASAESTQLYFNPYPTYISHPQSGEAPATAASANSATAASQPAHAPAVSAPAANTPAATQSASRGALPPQVTNADSDVPAGALAYAAPAVDEPASPPSASTPSASTAATPKHPSVAARPSTPSNQVLNSAQIASIRERLKLSAYQDQLWPPVESALKDVSWQRKGNARPTIDPNSAPVQRLKSAAVPLIMSLSSDQKDEVRSMVRLMGLENLAAQF